MRRASIAAALLVVIPMLVLALYPPTAFDETMYHLPLVRAMAQDGLRFHEELRFPAFPLLAELLALPLFFAGGDALTHLVPFAALLLTALLLVQWARRRNLHPQLLAAAAFLGAPIAVHLGTSLYVEAVLTLFVVGGFYALERARPDPDPRWLLLAGLSFGAACATKYLGLYFAGVAALTLIRSRRFLPFAIGLAIAALPMYAWIYAQTGDPLFPYLHPSLWSPPMPPHDALVERFVRLLRIPWDVLFARDRLGAQPPFTPLFSIALVAAIAMKRSRWMILGYLAIFTFLPQDARYLLPLLPLVLIDAATLLPRLRRGIAIVACIVAVLPGPAYAIYRIAKQGPLPLTRTQQTAYLERRVPAYHALQLAGTRRVYTCGGEHFKAYARGPFFGDHVGLHSFERVLLHPRMHANLVALDIDTLFVVKARCTYLPLPAPGLALIYEDDAAQLWQVLQ